ncbi:MAG: hypothetical protein AB7G13_32795 [Lautropia sp.]
MNSAVHATARLCAASAADALAHLASAAGLARWSLGLDGCRETDVAGLYTGTSRYDGSVGWVAVTVDAARGLVDYAVGASAQTLVPRIRACVQPAEALGYPPGRCLVTLLAWRAAAMDDARWQRLVHAHEAEIELIQAQLAQPHAAPAGRSGPPAATPPGR